MGSRTEESHDWILHFVWPFSSGADNGDSEDSEEGSEVDFAPRYNELDSFNLYLFGVQHFNRQKEFGHMDWIVTFGHFELHLLHV